MPVLGTAAISGLESSAALTAGIIYVAMRVALVVLYYARVPMIRGGVWTIGNLSLLYIVYVLFSSGTVTLL